MLSLPPGVYAFSIEGGADGGEYGSEVAMPAINIGIAPIQSDAFIDFFASSGTLDRWLAFPDDRIVVRVTKATAGILLTSLRRPIDPTLSIGVRRIDVPQGPPPQGPIPAQVMVHVPQLGDLFFSTGQVLPMGPGLWIEAFIVSILDGEGKELLEYRGITEDGYETPWLSDSVLCGSRGRGTPLIGFAVRLRGDASDSRSCKYIGHFRSGQKMGPLGSGQWCRSTLVDDPLEGIEFGIEVQQ
jgi:hypothetical protein